MFSVTLNGMISKSENGERNYFVVILFYYEISDFSVKSFRKNRLIRQLIILTRPEREERERKVVVQAICRNF